MRNVDLGKKLILLVCIPLTAFLLMTAIELSRSYHNYQQTTVMLERAKDIELTSNLIHELQKERGLSVGWINSTVSKNELFAQQELVNSQLTLLKQESNDVAKNFEQRLLPFRDQVFEKRISAGEVFKIGTEMIAELLAYQLNVIKAFDLGSLLARAKSMYTLEFAKEHAGQLRAYVNGILGTNTAITQEQYQKVIFLLGAVDQHLHSPTLSLVPETIDGIQKFDQSEEWKSVNATVMAVLKNSEKGNFRHDPKMYFATITTAINKLAKLVQIENKSLLKDIRIIKDQSKTEIFSFISLAIIVFTSQIVILWYMIRNLTKP